MRITDININSGLTFYGNIPPKSDKEHLGIILVHDDVDIQYCYCTSQEKIKRIYKNYYTITKENMLPYFPNNAKDSYIVLSQNFILNILCITFVSNINNGEFDYKGFLDENIFKGLLKAILSADTISNEFKKVIKEYFKEI
jgi:hypothetical protein